MWHQYLKSSLPLRSKISICTRIVTPNSLASSINKYNGLGCCKRFQTLQCKSSSVLHWPRQKWVPHPMKPTANIYFSYRFIWGWLNSIFNRVDESRILDAGPDRACAEWLLRCGAAVKWVNSENFLTNYNSLPIAGAKMFKIAEVDATDSSIMHIGFSYFKNCKHIRRVVMHRAMYLEDEGLSQLSHLKNSLKELEISSCGNISRAGLNHLKKLRKLEHLLLYDFPLINDKEEVIRDLQEALPNCKIFFPYAQASERPQEDQEAT